MKRIMCVSAFFITFVLGAFVCALAGPLPDTGQTKCYDNSVEITCPEAGEDFYGQDAQYTINPPSYTKLDAEGNDLPDSATSWSMVRDNVTGLIWEVKTDDGSIHDEDNTYTWQDAQDVFIAELNSSSFGGHSDWRLPNMKEFLSIAGQSVDTDYFPHTVSYYYWSSTTFAANTSLAWSIIFNDGYDSYPSKSISYYARAVRGGQTGSFDHLVINGDGTVTDTSTGLMWQQATDSSKNWKSTLSYCEGLSVAGYTDWRLPNIKESQSIVDYQRYQPAVDTDYFPTVWGPYSSFWSSTTCNGCSWGALSINFSFGANTPSSKSISYYARAVRGGQNRLLGHLVILTPDQASSWNIGNSMAITWKTQSISGNVKISISRQGGKDGTFETIEESTENDGVYNWTVAGTASVNCVLKIEPIDDTSKGTTQGLFTIYNMPTLSTGSATSVTASSATLNGTVNPNGSSTTYYFEYGTTTSYGSMTTSTSAGTGTSDVSVNASLTGLNFNTTYHFRVTATNSGATTYGDNQTFTTSSGLPSVTTGSATSVTASSATLNGTVNPNGLATTYYFEYGTTANYGAITGPQSAGSGSSDTSVSAYITGLSPNTTYHYRLVATNNIGTNEGSDGTFTTSGSAVTAPTVTTGSATSVSSDSATLNGTVNPNGADTTYYFEYGTTTSYGLTTASGAAGSGTSEVAVNAPITGLTNTTYHYRLVASNSTGTGYGTDQTFTPSALVPIVTTGLASSVTSSSAVLNGTVNPNGRSTTYHFQYGTTTSYGSTTASTSAGSGSSAVSASASITGLSSKTTYHYRLVATNSAGTTNGTDQIFTTSAPKATLSISSGTGTRGEKTTLPITLTNVTGTDIAAVSVDIGYDTEVFGNLKATIGPAGSAVDKTVVSSEPSPGVFRVTVFSASNNTAIGDGVIAYLELKVASDAPGSETTITCSPSASDPLGEEVTVEGSDGTVTIIGFLAGDCNGDGTVSVAEVQSAINMALGIIPVEDCVDVNGNGKVSIGEVQKVINNHMELSSSDYTAFFGDNANNARVGNAVPSLTISRATGELGETVTVSVSLTNASGYEISALLTNITYDTNVLENPTVEIGPAGTAAGKTVTSSEPSSGTFRIGVLSVSNNSAIGDGVVAYVSFDIRADASLGVTTLQNSPEASDPSGNDVSIEERNGSITAETVIYVDPNDECGGNTPCLSTIQDGIDSADIYSVIKVSEGTYDEDIIIDEGNNVTIQGGWDSTFTTQSSNTVINSLTITGTGGTVEIENVVLQ